MPVGVRQMLAKGSFRCGRRSRDAQSVLHAFLTGQASPPLVIHRAHVLLLLVPHGISVMLSMMRTTSATTSCRFQ